MPSGKSCSICLSVLRSFLVPCAAVMSRSPPSSSVDDKTFFLEYRCHPVRPEPPSPTSPPGKCSFAPAPAAASVPPVGSPTSAEPRRIVLSTDSPAALKVGTQQLIPKSLAVSTKTKNNPSRQQSVGANREPLSPDPKGAAIPCLSLEVEDDGGGALKRNLRNMSYRAAMKGPGAETEPVNAVPSLKPVLEEGSTLPARSPGRNKVGFAPAVARLLSGGDRAPAFPGDELLPGNLRSLFSCMSLSVTELRRPAVEPAGLAERGDVTRALGSLRVTSRCCRSPESPARADVALAGSVTGCSGALACRRAAAGTFAGWGWLGVGLRGSQTWIKQVRGEGDSRAGKVQV